MQSKSKAWLLIIIAALGYFVDIFDLILFQVVKKASLQDIGVAEADMFGYEVSLFNFQMTGMLVGGLLWGIMGDRLGRLQVLFGSIFLYSVANIANAFADNTTMYALWRFVAGFGLAGELGAGITLVVETMSKEKRGYGTMIIVTFGALGAVVAPNLDGETSSAIASFLGLKVKGWQMTYIIGGALGLLLLILRVGAFESGMFRHMRDKEEIKKGDIRQLFNSRERFVKYLMCICTGLPIWFVVGVLIAFSDKFAVIIGVEGKIAVKESIMYTYIGLSSGDLLCGLLSQLLKSRRKVVIYYILALSVSFVTYLFIRDLDAGQFYLMCFVLGFTTGYWALFVTVASEQFGTNIRSTVTNTVPNFVRGATVPMSWGFKQLAESTGNIVLAAMVVGGIAITLALISIIRLRETFSKDLNYFEID